MALLYKGRLARSGGLKDAIFATLTRVNLKACKRITIKYDPFRDDVREIRDFNYSIQEPYVINKNVRCIIKTEILNDKSEHSVEVEAVDGQKFLFKCGNLTQLELLQLFNQHISPLAPAEEQTTVAIPAKLQKKKK